MTQESALKSYAKKFKNENAMENIYHVMAPLLNKPLHTIIEWMEERESGKKFLRTHPESLSAFWEYG